MEEPGGLQPMGSQRVGHNLATKTTTKQQQGTKILHAMWHDQKKIFLKVIRHYLLHVYYH